MTFVYNNIFWYTRTVDIHIGSHQLYTGVVRVYIYILHNSSHVIIDYLEDLLCIDRDYSITSRIARMRLCRITPAVLDDFDGLLLAAYRKVHSPLGTYRLSYCF